MSISITADLIRGHTETIILAALMQGDSYGYAINRTINRLTEGQYELKEATLYTAFRRLEDADLIRSYWGDEATGARRRYYAITPQGRKEYARRLAEWLQARDMLDTLVMIPTDDHKAAEIAASDCTSGSNNDSNNH